MYDLGKDYLAATLVSDASIASFNEICLFCAIVNWYIPKNTTAKKMILFISNESLSNYELNQS